MSFTPLGKELQKIFSKNKPLQKQLEASFVIETAVQIFEELFGMESKKFVKPLFLKNRTLTISCTNSVFAQEIRLRQNEILEKINLKLGDKEVDRIRYLS